MRAGAILPCVVAAAISGAALGQQQAATFNFDGDRPGPLPSGWITGTTRATAGPATWQIAADPAAPSPPNVLALARSDNYDGTFNLAMARDTAFRDLDLSVRVVAVRGQEDQGGGPIWRCRDENNYYICRFNPLESNFRVYRVSDGTRRQLDSVEVETRAGTWYTVRIVMTAERIACYLDGTKLLEAADDTFKDAGMVGLWTKADAVTSFDDMVITPPGAESDQAARMGRISAEMVSAAVGGRATIAPDGVVRVTWPRSDVSLRIDGVTLRPAAGLTSWAALMPGPEGAIVTASTVLFQDEVTPALDAALDGGLEVTALCANHLFDEPPVSFMRLAGTGTAQQLAESIGRVWAAVRQVRSERPEPPERSGGPVPVQGAASRELVEAALKRPCTLEAGVVKCIVGRQGSWRGQPIGASMGLASWTAFFGTDDLAAVDGEIVVTAEEIQQVLRALRRAGLQVTAINHHMVGEEPACYFVHFRGTGQVAAIAASVASVLDEQVSAAAHAGE